MTIAGRMTRRVVDLNEIVTGAIVPARQSRSRVLIRPERPGDAARVHAIHAAAFATAAEARLVDRLRAAGHLRVSLLAEVDDLIVGHVAFSPVTASSGAAGAGLAPISVVDRYRRRGIAAGLVRKGLEVGGATFQALELVRGALPVGGGLVRYAPEFGTLGV